MTKRAENERRAVIPRERFRGGGRRAKPNPQREFSSLGAPPKDPLEAYVWALQGLQVSLYHVMNDLEMSETARRKEMREITRAMASLEPKARLYDAESRVRGDEVRLEQDQTGPEMTDAAELADEAYRATAKRGRPRK